jgi:hypothetical protein
MLNIPTNPRELKKKNMTTTEFKVHDSWFGRFKGTWIRLKKSNIMASIAEHKSKVAIKTAIFISIFILLHLVLKAAINNGIKIKRVGVNITIAIPSNIKLIGFIEENTDSYCSANSLLIMIFL